MSCAWVRHYGEISFFFGGSTVANARRSGAYTALVNARVECAAKKGSRFVVSECSPDSQVVLTKLGFTNAGHGREFYFDVE